MIRQCSMRNRSGWRPAGARAVLRATADQAFADEFLAAALLLHYERFRLRDPDAARAVLTLADRVDGAWEHPVRRPRARR